MSNSSEDPGRQDQKHGKDIQQYGKAVQKHGEEVHNEQQRWFFNQANTEASPFPGVPFSLVDLPTLPG